MMHVDAWAKAVLAKSSTTERIEMMLPALRRMTSRWETTWRAFWPDEPEAHIETIRDAVTLLERVARGDAPTAAELAAAATATDLVAQTVGEDAQNLDGEDDPGPAHAMTALVAIAVAEAHGVAHDIHTFDEVVTGMPFIVESYPSLDDAFRDG